MSPKRSVYETSIGPFAAVCRHCGWSKSKHVEGKCLFEATSWDPLTQAEWWKLVNLEAEHEEHRIALARERLEAALPRK